jgi:sporulation protein YlmC with PRC-barrel domain
MKNAWTLVALSLGTAFATGLSAQNTPDRVDPLGNQSGERAQSASQPNTDESSKPVDRIRASELLGVNVTSKLGENVGEVQDLIIDPETGEIQLALVGKGFMAGLGDRVVPLPWQALNVRSQQKFVVNIDHQKLQKAPAWSDAEPHSHDYVIRIYRFYELEPETGVGGAGESGQQSGQGEGRSEFDSDQSLGGESSQRDQFKPDETAPQPDK